MEENDELPIEDRDYATHEECMEYQALITEQIKVLNESYQIFEDSETIQKKIREKIVQLIDLL